MAPINKLAGVVLAAGGSQRLGQPKQLINWQGETLVNRMADLAGQFCSAGVVVVTGCSADAVAETLIGSGAELVFNPDWSEGIAGSLKAGLRALDEVADAGLVLLCDQPLVKAPDLEQLVDAWSEEPLRPAASAYNNTLGVPAIFPRLVFEDLFRLTGDQGAGGWLRKQQQVSVVDMPAAAFDIDTREDLETLIQQQ